MAAFENRAPPGLPNPGWNACFINSVLQGLAAVPSFTQHIATAAAEADAARRHAAPMQSKEGAHATASASASEHASILSSTSQLLHALWQLIMGGESSDDPELTHSTSAVASHAALQAHQRRLAACQLVRALVPLFAVLAPGSDQQPALPSPTLLPPGPPSPPSPPPPEGAPAQPCRGNITEEPSVPLCPLQLPAARSTPRMVPMSVLRPVLSALQAHATLSGTGALGVGGEQHDAVEALEGLCSALEAELASWCSVCATWGGLRDVAGGGGPGTAGATTATAAQPPADEAATATAAANATTTVATTTLELQSASSPAVDGTLQAAPHPPPPPTTTSPLSPSSSPAQAIYPSPSHLHIDHSHHSRHSHSRLHQLPLRGLLSHTLTCTTCGNHSISSLTPFWVLPLPVPHTISPATGLAVTLPGLDVHLCLARFLRAVPIDGVCCSKCTLEQAAALLTYTSLGGTGAPSGGPAHPALPTLPAHPGNTPVPPPASTSASNPSQAAAPPPQVAGSAPQEQQQQQQRAQGLTQASARQLVACLARMPDPLPDVELLELMDKAGLGGLGRQPVPLPSALQALVGSALPRPPPQGVGSGRGRGDDTASLASLRVLRGARQGSSIAHWPPVLVLQLRRSEWDMATGRPIKVHGPVHFPLVLDVSPHTQNPISGQRGDDAGPRYALCAAIEHLGGTASGHYVVYRRSGCMLPASGGGGDQEEEGDEGGRGIQGHEGEANAGGAAQRCAWFRVSDAVVSQVGVHEVLGCEASVLLYQRL